MGNLARGTPPRSAPPGRTEPFHERPLERLPQALERPRASPYATFPGRKVVVGPLVPKLNVVGSIPITRSITA